MTGFRSGSIELLRRLVLVAGLVLSLPSIAAVQLLLERDIDISGQTDLFLVSYADQAGFLSNTGFSQTSLPQPIAGNFSVGGFTVDAIGGWHLLLERDIDVSGQTDLFLVSYADQAGFLSNTGFTQTALPQAIAGNFSVGGFHIDLPAPPSPPDGVPEPGSLPLLMLGVALMFWCGLARRGVSGPDCYGYSIGSRGLAM